MSMRCRYIVLVDKTRAEFFWATASIKSSVNSKLIESVTDFKQKSPATDLLGELACPDKNCRVQTKSGLDQHR
jgi:hypothetical protein